MESTSSPSKVARKEKRRLRKITKWLRMSTDEVLDTFASLPNAIRDGKGSRQYVYVPGRRNNKVLLVSHADTVWDNEKISLQVKNGIILSDKKRTGIGADDRAGCAMLWRLRNSGHSLLIPSGEEKGCIGARYLESSNPKLLQEINQQHCFAIEFDRMNDSDIVTYSVGSQKFEQYLESRLKGFSSSVGSFTDICVLCTKMCGANISVGYYNQHSSSEYLIISEWRNTLKKISKLLKTCNLPRFEQEPINYEAPTRHAIRKQYSDTNITITEPVDKAFIECSACHIIMSSFELKINNMICPYCNN